MSWSKVLLPKDDEHTALACPACGGECIHQGDVEVWDREEDATGGNHVVIPRLGHVRLDQSVASGNPSRRRQGLAITFRCEMCTAKPRLLIWQHKGSTFVRWECDRAASV